MLGVISHKINIRLLAVMVAGIMTALAIVLVGGAKSAHAATFTVTNTNADGAGSFYQAVVDANASPDADVINFNIPGEGPHTINYVREDISAIPNEIGGLPTITNPVTIDACTQPGSDCNIDSLNLMIELRGDYTGPSDAPTGLNTDQAGITISDTADVTVRGFMINRVMTYAVAPPPLNIVVQNPDEAVEVQNSSNVTIESNILGTDNDGTPGIGAVGSLPALRVNESTDTAVLGNIIGGYANGIGTLGTDPPAITSSTLIESNIIGTNNAGSTELGGAGVTSTGVSVGSSVEGTTIRNNTIANYSRGVSVASYRSVPLPQLYSSDTTIVGNNIGMTPDGSPLGNTSMGILAGGCSDGVQIGGLGDGEANDIAYGANAGIIIADSSECSTSTQGYTIIGNQIRDNDGAGVIVGGTQNPTAMTVRRNAIFNNGGLGIDLSPTEYYGDGVTENGAANELREGPNSLVNYPVITGVEHGSTIIAGEYTGMANQTYTLDFYVNDEADPSGHGQGQEWIGSDTVTTDDAGNVTFQSTFDVDIADGQFVAATATNAAGSTSEFGEHVIVPTAPDSPQTPENPTAEENGNDEATLADTGSSLAALVSSALSLIVAGFMLTLVYRKKLSLR